MTLRRELVNDLIAERYEPLDVLGRTQAATVLRAWDHRHLHQVVLRVHNRELDAARQRMRRFLELRPNPHLPLVRDDFEADGRYYVIEDWVEGLTLTDVLVERGRPGLAFADVVGWVRDVAAALDHLHAQYPPLIHGHVHPGNVILTASGRVVLVDHAEPPPGYLAPEDAAPSGPGVPADIYALAATGFALLTGSPPSVEGQVRLGAVADSAAGTELALRRGLASEPSRRPPSAGRLASGLIDAYGHVRDRPAHRFIGRTAELADVRSLLEVARTVTLTGPPGVGKSRLATEVARLVSDLPGGAVVVPMDTHGTQGARDALGQSVGLGPAATTAALVRRLGGRRLLVLDDCDRHVETVADVVTELLAACPHLRVLASSREPLRVPGEMTYDVRPLRPADTTRLFEELSGDEQQALGDLRDGLPLAIELAVATIEARPGPEHHRSMQAAIDWSYDLLSPAEQALFGRLSHFVGPFSLDAVEEECVGGCVERDDVIALLLALVAKSLVVAEEDHGDTRYRLLDALRRYGEGRRPAEGDACPDARGWDSHTRSEEER
jgi:hypothetical protein